jgi:glucose-6-phosphate 1-dehydrogenase
MSDIQSDALVFFGATGDLAFKQIFPALQALVRHGHLRVPVIGVAREPWDAARLRDRARDSLEQHGGVDEPAFASLCALLQYVAGEYTDPGTYERLRAALGAAQHPLHYLAIPPSMFGTVVEGLRASGSATNARVVVEKPFGRDLDSARALNHILRSAFPQDAIYRIDHFLGKEPVQNLIYTRFANSFFEPIWNRNYIDHMQITMAESFGVQDRGRFYEEAGAIRDVLQNHLLQVLACLTMEAPTSEGRRALLWAKTAALQAMNPLRPEDVVRGQFRGYRSVPGVAPDSAVETFTAVKVCIETWRWAGVPCYIRAGKCLPVTACEVLVTFKRPPFDVFAEHAHSGANYIRFQVSPDVLTAIDVRGKTPGEAMAGHDVELIATEHSGDEMEPYERLLGDAMRGDPTLFASEAAVEAQWHVVDPIIGNVTPVRDYEPNTWGPAEADQLIAPSGRWHNPQPAPRAGTTTG